jgi:hypothetical protein
LFNTVSIVFGLRKTSERDREQSPDKRRELLARERSTVEVCELLAYGNCHTCGSCLDHTNYSSAQVRIATLGSV